MSVVAGLREKLERPQTGWFHIRREDLRAGSALIENPSFASFDVVLRRDFEETRDALLANSEALDSIRHEITVRTKAGDTAESILTAIEAILTDTLEANSG